MSRSERWVVRHDSMPRPVEFTYPTEAEAVAAFEESRFYDPATGWGVTLLRRVVETEVLASTYPKKEPRP